MADDRAVLSSCFYVEGLNITEYEKEQHEAKFKAWYDSFLAQHGEELARIRSGQHGA